MANTEQQALVDRFVGDLEAYLGIKATRMSIADRWLQCPPEEANGKTIEEFLDKVLLGLLLNTSTAVNGLTELRLRTIRFTMMGFTSLTTSKGSTRGNSANQFTSAPICGGNGMFAPLE